MVEIGWVEDGYRPRNLFAAGLPPVREALMPVAAPSFVDDLARSGHAMLAEELRHAAPGVAPEARARVPSQQQPATLAAAPVPSPAFPAATPNGDSTPGQGV